MSQNCPWSRLADWSGKPNVDWCEASTCGWAIEPANTWSNLAYLVVAVVIWWWFRASSRKQVDPRLRWFGPSVLVVGIFSLVYHASVTFFFQVFDFVGMFVLMGLLLALNLSRTGNRRFGVVWVVSIVIPTALVFLLRSFEIAIQPLVGVFIAVVLITEWRCFQAGSRPLSYRSYSLALVLLAVAGVASLVDVTRVWCDPDNHWLQGHAVWHVLAALSMLPLYRFYEGVLPRCDQR